MLDLIFLREGGVTAATTTTTTATTTTTIKTITTTLHFIALQLPLQLQLK